MDSDEELRELIAESGERLVVVDWSATWCEPCDVMLPVFEGMSHLDEMKGVTFIHCEIDELPDASVEAGVSSIPTFHFIRHRQLIDQLIGADEERLLHLIRKYR